MTTMKDDLRRRATELVQAEARYYLPAMYRYFLVGLACGITTCSLITKAF